LKLGYHTYGLEQPDFKAIATRITLETIDPLQESGRWAGTPATRKFDDAFEKWINIHETSPTWLQEIRVPAEIAPGRYPLTGKIRFKVCDDKGCLPPREEKFAVTLEVKAASGQTEPARTIPGNLANAIKSGPEKKVDKTPTGTRPNPKHPASFAAWADPEKGAPGGTVELHVRVEVDKPWHIYSTTMKQGKEGPRATVIRLSESAGLEPRGGFRSSMAPKRTYDPAVEMETEYHEDEVTWKQVLRVPRTAEAGLHTLKGSILHQLCKASSCLPPLTVPFEVGLELSPEGSLGTADSVANDLLAASPLAEPDGNLESSTAGPDLNDLD